MLVRPDAEKLTVVVPMLPVMVRPVKVATPFASVVAVPPALTVRPLLSLGNAAVIDTPV
jgi:hypothetical protein